MINPDQANMQGKLGFFFGGLAALCLVWAHFRIPETMGRTFEELDILFNRKVSARDFKNYVIEGTLPVELGAVRAEDGGAPPAKPTTATTTTAQGEY